MLLPNHAEAIIPVEKLRDYLLKLGHPKGHDKAVILTRIGFVPERWQELELELRRLIQENDAVEVFGFPQRRFRVAGEIVGPEGSRDFWTIWLLDAGGFAPRFSTAYPRPRRRR